MGYSQYGEEEVLNALLEKHQIKTGTFLDIGAYDGKTFSNTRALAERGWSGVLVEPAPGPLEALLKLYEGNPRVAIVGAVISASGSRDLIWFWDASGDGLSTTETKHRQKWQAAMDRVGNKFRMFCTIQIPVWDLLSMFPHTYDVVSIDTEGTSSEIWAAIPDAAIRETRVVIVEHDGENDKMIDILNHGTRRGFRVVLCNETNTLLERP